MVINRSATAASRTRALLRTASQTLQLYLNRREEPNSTTSRLMQPLPTRPPLGPITLHPTSRPKGGPIKGSLHSVRPVPYQPVHMEPARTSSPHAVAKLLPVIEEFELADEPTHASVPRKSTSPARRPPGKPKLAPHQRVGMAKLTPLSVAAKVPVGFKPSAAKAKASVKKAKDPAKQKEKEQKLLEKEKKEKAQALFHERVWNKLVKLLDIARQKSFFLSFIPFETFEDKTFYTEHAEWASLAYGRGTWMVNLLEQSGYSVKIRKIGESAVTAYEISGWAKPGSEKK